MSPHPPQRSPVPDDALPTTRRRHRLFALPLAVLLFSFSLAADRVLALIGVPVEVPVQVAHPPSFREIRRNLEFTQAIGDWLETGDVFRWQRAGTGEGTP